MAEGFIAFVFLVAVTAVLFLVFRAIVLWYWRVNEAVALLKSMDEKLGRLAATQTLPSMNADR